MIVFSMESLFIMYKVNINLLKTPLWLVLWSMVTFKNKEKMHQSLKSIIKYMFRC